MVAWRKLSFKKMFVTLVFGTLVAALVVVINSKQVLAADSLRKLNLQDVAQLILKNSLKKEESNLTYQSTLIKPTQALSGLDYTLSVETGWEQSRFENFTNAGCGRNQF
jgi:Na+-transporting NADH:ubiquinone oxidoreductase subunit NqrC